MKKIFDYNGFIRRDSFKDRGIDQLSGDINLFFHQIPDNTCPFCKIKLSLEHQFDDENYPEWLLGGKYVVSERVYKCTNCGWWNFRCDKDTTGEIVDGQSVEIIDSILRQYDLSDKKIPIEVLQKYLVKNFQDVIHINDKSMEKLVQSVFAEHFNCKVEHIGKSHDGGIDLLLIDSDNPTVVQVKRRKKLAHTESVSGIRDLLGATILKESKNCIYVSTCEKFSDPAKEAAEKAVKIGAIESYELYDFNRFNDILKLTSTSEEIPWKRFLERK